MLRFLRSHITNATESKAEDLTDFFSYSKTATHGFPQKSSCLAVDEQLGLLAIGTKDGRIRIVGGEGIEWSTTIESGLPLARLYFTAGSGVVVALCDDPRTSSQSFHRCQIVNDRLSVMRLGAASGGGTPKRITCCEMLNREDGNSALLIGTSTGNIFALWTQNMELVEYLIFQDSSLRRLSELCDVAHRIDKIVVHPHEAGKLFLLFNNAVVVLYDTLQDECERVFTTPKPITDIYCSQHGSTLYCAKLDGSYATLALRNIKEQLLHVTALYHGVGCTEIRKIASTRDPDAVDSDLIAFTGGVPADLYGDRYTLTMRAADRCLVLDFESPIIDFIFLSDPSSADSGGSALFILCEQELVAIDVRDAGWRPFILAHFNPLHASPVTATTVASHVAPGAFARLCALAERMEAARRDRQVSGRAWPLRCGSGFSAAQSTRAAALNPHDVTLLITGHENGCVNVWLTNLLSVRPWISCNTALEFEVAAAGADDTPPTDAVSIDALDADELPLRRAGLFDSFCDDPGLTIVKLEFDAETASLSVGGRAGHVIVFEADVAEPDSSLPAIHTISIDMAADGREESSALATLAGPATSASTSRLFVRNKEGPLRPRRSFRRRVDNYGFVPAFNTVVQFAPVVQVTAVAYATTRALLAAGNEFGYVICALRDGELLAKCCLLAVQDVVQISSLDGTLSRFKSVKKSIRQSFRRKRRQINCGGGGVVDTADERALSIMDDFRSGEREISSRVANPSGLDGETPHSLVKVLQILHCRLGANLALADYLFVGTFGGAVYVHHLPDTPMTARRKPDHWPTHHERDQSALLDDPAAGGGGERWDARCPLVKEIRLRHRASIVNIECVQDLLASRLFVYTEEQIRAFMLPTLKPSRYKCKFTAHEGSRIRKAGTILMRNAKTKRVKLLERFIGLCTNRGEVYVVSLQNPHRMMHVPFTQASDAAGIASAVLSTEGELFYVRPGGSELQRASIAASPNYSAPTPFRDEQFLATIV